VVAWRPPSYVNSLIYAPPASTRKLVNLANARTVVRHSTRESMFVACFYNREDQAEWMCKRNAG